MVTESWVVSGPQVIELEDVHALRVGLVGGRVDVVASEEPGARVEVHDVHGRPLEVSLVDGVLKVGYSHTLGGWENILDKLRALSDKDAASVHVAVPAGTRVSLATVCAEGLVVGIKEDAKVATVSGAVVVDQGSGALTARTVSGEVTVREHSGDIALTTVSGELTASGDLRRVTTSSVSGAVSLDLTSTTSSITANSVSGDVTVRLPEGVGLGIEANVVTGRIVVDGVDETGGRPGRTKLDTRSGGTGCWASVNTVSGNVTVLRRAAA